MRELDEFTLLFHSINGKTVKEKNRNFNKFLKLLQSNCDKGKLKVFIKSIIPKTHLEEIFKIEIIIQSQIKELLLDEIKTNNAIFVHKLLKEWRLFGELFLTITSTELLNNILPHLSYSLKCKILNGIRKNVKNEKLLDEYFADIEKRYGLRIAAIILPGCSISVIKSQIEKFQLDLPQSHLKAIFKKDRQFVEFYFNTLNTKYENVNFSIDYLSTLKYIARIDPRIYWELHDKYGLRVTFGKHTTPYMIRTSTNILEKGCAALDYKFHDMKLFKTTKKDGTLNSFLLNLCPENHYKFKDEFLTLRLLGFIKKGPVSQQYYLISNAFLTKYKENLLEYPNYFTEDLLKITPLKEREAILNYKVLNEEELYYLYGTSISIPRFKMQLEHSFDVKTRSNYGWLLYRTCLVNKDEVRLLDVLRYVLSRHNNDKGFLITFLDSIVQWPNIMNLSEEHWKYIVRLYSILEKSEYYITIKFLEYHICHLLKNNKPISDLITKQIQEIIVDTRYSFIHIYDIDYQKKYCDAIAKALKLYKGHEKFKLLRQRFFGFIEYVQKYRTVSALDYVEYFDHLDENDVISFDRMKLGFNYDDERIHKIFWKLNRVVDNRLILWYAIHRPDLLQKNLQKLSTLANINKIDTFLRKFKKLCDPDIVEEIKAQALQAIENKNYSRAIFPLRAISLLNPDNFLDMIQSLLPTDGKINLEEITADKLKLQKEIAKGLSNIANHSKSFPLILKFCVGDYLKIGLQPLYKVAYNMPELQIMYYLNKLSEPQVSVRKHMLLLSIDLFTKDDFYKLLTDWSQNETNLSLRNILLKKSIRHFIESPSEHTWRLLKSNLKSRDADDRAIYDFLLKFEKLSSDDLGKYLEILYEEISNNSDPKINEIMFQLISTIPNGIIKKLNEKFLIQIINDTVCCEQSTNFYWKCVFYVKEDLQSILFEENFVALKRHIQKNASDLKQNEQVRLKITTFLSHFINLALELKQNLDFIQRFMTTCTSLFDIDNFLKEFMLIRFAELYFKNGFDTYQTGLEIMELLYEYIKKYNSSIIDSYCTQVCNFLQITRIAQNKEDLFKFIEGIFQQKTDESAYIATMYFLPKTLPKIDNDYANYIPIINEITSSNSAIIHYHFDNYLSDCAENICD